MLKPIQRLTFLFLIVALTAKTCGNPKVSKPTVVKNRPLDKNDEKSEEEHRSLTHTGAKKGQPDATSDPALATPLEFEVKQKETALQAAIVHKIKVPKITQDKQEAQAVTDSQLVSNKDDPNTNAPKNDRNNEENNEGRGDDGNNNTSDDQAQETPSKKKKGIIKRILHSLPLPWPPKEKNK